MSEKEETQGSGAAGQPHWRQLDLVNPELLRLPITIIGAGAIGSFVALALAKMGANAIRVFDPAVVRPDHWQNQFYGPLDAGRPKAEALQTLVLRQTGQRLTPTVATFDGQKLAGIVIVAVDRPEARQAVWKRARLNPAIKLLIEAGQDGSIAALRPIDPESIHWYDAYSPGAGGRLPIHQALTMAGLTAGLVRTFVTKGRWPSLLSFDGAEFRMRTWYRGKEPLPKSGPPLAPFSSLGSFETPVTVVGAGAVGSLTVLAMAKMGLKRITVFDHDTVEEHNWPNQYYGPEDIGQPKVQALRRLVLQQSGLEIDARHERYVAQLLRGVVIPAVDSMKVRALVWQQALRQGGLPFYIDPRLGGLAGLIFAGRPTDPDFRSFYEHPEVLYPDERAKEEPCTARAVIDNILTLDGQVAGLVHAQATARAAPRSCILDCKNFFLVTQTE